MREAAAVAQTSAASIGLGLEAGVSDVSRRRVSFINADVIRSVEGASGVDGLSAGAQGSVPGSDFAHSSVGGSGDASVYSDSVGVVAGAQASKPTASLGFGVAKAAGTVAFVS